MRQVVVLQVLIVLFLVPAAVTVETGNRRLVQPLRYNQASCDAAAYAAADHTGEVVFLGSSQVGSTIIPGCVEAGLRTRGLPTRAYALWFPGAVAPTQYTAIRDLVLRHGKPRLVVMGLAPRDLNATADGAEVYVEHVASLSDAARLIARRPMQRAGLVWRAAERTPATILQIPLMGLWRRGVEEVLQCRGSRWRDPAEGLAAQQANQAGTPAPGEAQYQSRLKTVRSLLAGYEFGDSPRWLEDTVRLARAGGVPVAWCVLSCSQRAQDDLAGAHVDEAAAELWRGAGDLDVPLWVLRDLNPRLAEESAYFDGVDHASAPTAAETSRLLGAGPVADLLLAGPGGAATGHDGRRGRRP